LNSKTIDSYQAIITKCRSLFHKKTLDYGTAWRILRLPSITDQIFIKAQRIRSIQEKGKQLVEEDITSEFIGIINYCVIALIQMELTDQDPFEVPAEQVMKSYDEKVNYTIELFQRKNHDYGEAWREMRISSITDIILMKLLRVKQIEDNKGKTLASEGVDANYQDMINYAVFCLIKMEFDK